MTRIFERAAVTAGAEVVLRSSQYFSALDQMLRNESDSRNRSELPPFRSLGMRVRATDFRVSSELLRKAVQNFSM